jgi:hypothetical protein
MRFVARAGLVLGVLVALVSYRYLLPSWPGAPPNVAGNSYAMPWLPLHAILAATALLVGPLQFSGRLRQTRPRLHRGVGRLYVGCCLVSGAAGLPLAVGNSAGPVAAIGFIGLSLAWLGTTALGFLSAARSRFRIHREWMVRSFALTFAAVTLRLYLPIPLVLGFTFMEGYRAIAFLCWIPNLIVAELWLSRTRRPPRTSAHGEAPAHRSG